MKQIVPASTPPSDNSNSPAPARVFDDALDMAQPPQTPFTVLHLLVVILCVFGLLGLGAWSQNHAPLPPSTGPYEPSKTPAQSKIIVHVAGAVKKPGVYTLTMDARIQDALQKAGGALPNGDPNQLNLAAWAEDGSRIEVPLKSSKIAREEMAATPLIVTAKAPEEIISDRPEPTKTPPKTEAKSAAPGEAKRDIKPMPARKINLNKATLEELTALPGVGPATAEKIIEHRQSNGAFSSVDDLDDIKGIGEKKLEKIRPYATVQ